MNAPVTAAVPGVRPAAPRAADAGPSHNAAPFASALDGALAENRASNRGIERRGMRDDRATKHAAEKDQRVEDRSRLAAHRALDKADRTKARTEQAAERAMDQTAGAAAPDASDTTSRRTADADETVPGEAVPEADDQRTDTAGKSAEAPRGGLPALWALMMGGSLAGAHREDADAGPTSPAAVPGMPGTGATATADAVVTLAVRSIVSTDSLLDSPATAAAGPMVGAPAGAVPETVVTSATAGAATAPAPPTGKGLPATFSAVLAAAGAVVTESAAPAAPAVPPGAPAPAAPGSLAQAATATATAPAPGGPPAVPSSVVQATDAEVALTEVAGSTDVAVAPIGSTSGEALSADGASQQSPGNAPATTGTTGPASVGTAGPAPATAAVPDVDGAPRSDPAPPVGSQVARQIAVLHGGPDGAHTMTLVLTPETLGPVEVQVTVTKGSVELALRGASEQGRAALLDGLPDLRRDLEAAGLSCSRLEVDRETGGSWLDRQPAQQQTSGERSGQHDRGDNRSRPWGRPADSGGSGTSAPENRSTSSGVDVLV